MLYIDLRGNLRDLELHSIRAKVTQIKPSIRVKAFARGDPIHFSRRASCIQLWYLRM